MKTKIYKKKDYLIQKCTGKKVLDLGCIEHDLFKTKMREDRWIHSHLKNVSSEIIGVDILTEYIEELNNQGYNIVYGNVEKLSEVNEIKNKQFDVIIAGDLIEHLFNAGLFLDSVSEFMHEKTELILTTPNCFSTRFIIPYVFRGEIVREDHTCWYSKKTLSQLLEMKNFHVTEFHYRSELKLNGIRPVLRNIFRHMFPKYCEGLIITARYKESKPE